MKKRRSPHGERGLKLPWPIFQHAERSRSPHGERGLKFEAQGYEPLEIESLPARGAWIEIPPIM